MQRPLVLQAMHVLWSTSFVAVLRRIMRLRMLVALLVCESILAASAGAHLHLCFDGQEPVTTVHFEGGLHPEHDGTTLPHNDANIDLGNDVINKLPQLDLSLLGLVLCLALPDCACRGAPFARVRAGIIFNAASRFLLPPLRGPPQAHSF